jgi:hypothetical protein
MDYDSSGEISELYGNRIVEKKNYLDYTALPVRAEVKSETLYTIVSTADTAWVVTIVGDDVTTGPPMLFTPDSLTHADIGLIPGKSEIDITKTYSTTESMLDDLTGRLVIPSGTFNCKFIKITEAEAMEEIAQINAAIIEYENREEYIPELTDTAGEDELSMPEGYPEDILPVSDDADIVMSETIPGEDGGGDGYYVTFTVGRDADEVLSEYEGIMESAQDTASYSASGVTTITGSKNGYSVSVMVIDSSTDEEDETTVQIAVIPLDSE